VTRRDLYFVALVVAGLAAFWAFLIGVGWVLEMGRS
jgi:hypothetical protein